MTINKAPSPCPLPEGEGLPLVERLDTSLEAVEAFRRLSGLPHVVYFDSAMRHRELGRYSFVAADPIEWISIRADGSDALVYLAGRAAHLPNTALSAIAAVSRRLGRIIWLRIGGQHGTRAVGRDRRV